MKKKMSIRKKVFISSLSLITIISVILTLVFVFSGEVKAIELDRKYGKYDSNQSIYDEKTTNSTNYISMTDAAKETNLSKKIITISTAEELYLFSNKCDPYDKSYNEAFLGYSYKLLNNIDCSTSSGNFVPIGYNIPFSGTFDGNGFEIKGLKFINLVSGNENAKKYMYSNDNDKVYSIQYFAMFSKNAGTITKLGLISPLIVLSYTPKGNAYIAPLVGENTGTVNCCYHKMLESNDENSSGISSQGGFFISGLVSINRDKGSITSVYSAVTILSQTSSTEVLTQAEIVNENSGTITEAYFYDETITKYTKENNKVSIDFDSSKVSNNLKDADHPGVYCESLSKLTEEFNESDNFYTLNDYNAEIQAYLKDSNGEFIYETPILRGIKADDGKTFTIKNANEFLYMYELFNLNSNFASKLFTYNIANDIDMSLMGAPEVTTQISATIKSSSDTDHKTIFNAPINDYYVTNMGIDCYGLFPWFSGSLSNIDIVLGTSSNAYSFTPKESNNKKAYGALVGYLDGGKIDNCNVYINTSFNDNINEYSVGGVVGYVGSIDNKTIGTISNTVVNGTINTISDTTASTTNNFSKIGGAVGYIDYTTGTITNVLSTVNLTSNSKCNLSIGGILGAGYINHFNNNQYGKKVDSTLYGNIKINGSFKYASGLIGRLLGVTNQIDLLTNYGSIAVNSTSTDESYLSGLINVDIIKSSAIESVSSLPLNNNGEYLFYASQLNSDCNITIAGKNINMHFTNGLNINTKNGFTSKISGLFNSTSKSGNTSNLLLNNISNFSGLVNSICDVNSSSMVYLDTVLNSKNYTFTTNNTIDSSIMVSSVANGKNINFLDIRNNGNLSFDLNHQTTKENNNNPNLIVNGVFEELSLNTSANKIYNAGNITVKDTKISSVPTNYININIYLSGICYKNLAVLTDNTQNPLKPEYDNTNIGSLNDVINNGMLLVTSENNDSNITTYIDNGNGSTTKADQSNVKNRLNGNVYLSGICYLNSGIISNGFNLANLELDAFSRASNTIYAIGGIASYLDGEYAQIRDSANDGTLQAINMAYANSTTNYAKMYIGGIVALNNKNPNNVEAIIAFTINYGTLVGYNGTVNVDRKSIGKLSCYVGGIVAYGASNIINVVNYGEIYGTEVVSSIVAGLDMSIYNNIKFNLANTINYGKVYLLEKFHFIGNKLICAKFSDSDIINNPNSALKYTSNGIYNEQFKYYYYLGSMFGIVNFGSGTTAQPNIRYVINFYNAPIVQSGNQINIPSTEIDTKTFITVYGSTDTFGGGSIKYAPMTNVSDNLGNIGVFSSDFIFRKAINKSNDAVDFSKYITDNYIADFYEFVRFDKVNDVLLDKIGWRNIAYVNAAEILAKNVKLMSNFVTKDNLNKTNSNSIFETKIFETTTWINNIDSTIISEFLSLAMESNELAKDDYVSIIQELFFGNYKSSITATIKNDFINKLMEFYSEKTPEEYKELLQSLLYDELLAKIISGQNNDYAAVQTKIVDLLSKATTTELRNTLTDYLNMLINDDNSSILAKMFDNDTDNYYLQKKVDLINTLLANYSDDAISTMAKDILSSSSTDSSVNLKAYNYLSKELNSNLASSIYSIMIASKNTSNDYLALLNRAFKKYDISNMLTSINEFDSTNYSDSEKVKINIRENDSSGNTVITEKEIDYTYINGTKITYGKDYSDLWNILKNNAKFQELLKNKYFKERTDPTSSEKFSGLIAKATEYNNTYQSNDGPSYLNSDDLNAKNGLIQINNVEGTINNRFIYTPDSVNTTATYYYGPFNKNGELFSVASLNDKNKIIGKDIYNAYNTTKIEDFYAPVFISTNENITKDHVAASNTTSDNQKIYPFYWHNGPDSGKDAYNQWVTDYILNGQHSGNIVNILLKNQNLGDYIVDGYDFSPDYKPTINKDIATKNGLVTINGTNTELTLAIKKELTYTEKDDGTHESFNNDGNTYYYTHPYKEYYLKGYISTSIYTGIWYITSNWVSGGKNVGCYLMSQYDTNNNNNHQINGYRGVQTTQYTYYTMDDLAKLDGVRTKSIDDPTAKDSTEIAIISALITDLLAKDTDNSVKNIFVKAIADYASKNDISLANANVLSKALNNTFASKAISEVFTLASIDKLKAINYKNNSESNITNLYEKFSDVVKSVNVTNRENLIYAGATDKEKFKKILLATLTDLTGYNNPDGKEITNYDFTYMLYRYIDYLKTNGISDDDIADYIASNQTDLEILTNLSNTDWKSYIDMYDGNADGSDSGIGYNSSTDLKKLYDKLNAQKETISGDTPYVPSNYALPISSESEDFIPQTGKTNVSLSTGTKQVSNATTQKANTNNIGYYVGDELKSYKETSISYDKFYYPNTSDQSIDLDSQNQNTYPSPSKEIRDYLKKKIVDSDINGNYLLRIASSQQYINGCPTNEGNLTYVKNGRVGNYSGDILLPKRTIWVAPVKVGVFKFVIVNPESTKTSFSVHRLIRSTAKNYSSYFTEAKSILTFNELLFPGKAYYFEIPITQEDINKGYEYAISGGDSKKPYVAYIDMGTSGNDASNSKYPNLSTIESNYTTNYLNHSLVNSNSTLSKFGLYLASNFITQVYPTKDQTTIPTSIPVTKPSILLIRALSGSVTIKGSTTYTYKDPNAAETDTGTEITIEKVSKSFNNDGYRAFYLSGGEYKIEASTDCTITDILLVDKEAKFNLSNSDNKDTISIKSGKDKESLLLYNGASYTDLNSFKINLNETTNRNNIITTLATIYGTYFTEQDKYKLFKQSYITIDKDFIKSLVVADNDKKDSVLDKLIQKLSFSDLAHLLGSVNDKNFKENIMSEIVKIVNKNTDPSKYSSIEKYIIAAYLGDNYLDCSNQLTKSKLYSLLKTYSNGEYQFIKNDTTIEPEIFISFINHLGGNADIEGYGIFALASSQGIKNGKFIPDNLTLSDLDNEYLKLDNEKSSWRGGTSDNINERTPGSVNYHFYVSMKQLKKSISTAIIEMDLTDNTNTLFANSNQITNNGSTGTITYYITKSQYDKIGSSLNIDTNNLIYAAGAKIQIGNPDNYSDITDTNNTISVAKNNGTLTTTSKIKVIAEDETVETIYDINFVIIDNDTYTYSLSSNVNLGSTGGDVTLSFETTNPKLENVDLTPFITIKNANVSYNYLTNRDDFKKYFSFYTTGFYQVVKKQGDKYVATIKFSVDQSLPYGDYTVSVDIGTNPNITMTKSANSEAIIEKIEFDHQSITVTDSMDSTILFGRTFSDTDFNIVNEIPDYLTDFKISSNATYTISHEIKYTTNGLRQFVVTYTITAEDEKTTKTYTHTLTEKAPFEGNYATVYKNGNDSKINTSEYTYSHENGTYLKATNSLDISFTRNEGAPSYRIYFNLNNFYIDSNTKFDLTDVTNPKENQGKSYLISSYAGLTASVTENCELGTYSYQYTYTDALGRVFYFPIVNIRKEYSTNSLISNLTFISSNISLGSAYTHINPSHAFVTNENNEDNRTKYHYEENEKYYNGFTNKEVTISNGAITYNAPANASGTNYYVLGTVSDVQLSDYAPTMKTDEYAQIYQYTTPDKLAKYNGNQTESDTSILKTEGNSIFYLYVPFYTDTNNNNVEDETDEHVVYLVKMTINNGKKILSTIYNASGVSDNDKVGEFPKDSELKNIHNLSFTSNGKTYKVSKSAGSEGNVSLNMNYIGNPSDGHFWYVSYAVFSESYINKDDDTTSINFYHISIVDLTNNIYFKIKVNTDSSFENSAIYLTVSYTTYDKGQEVKNTLSCYAIKPTAKNDDGTYTFTTQYDLAMLPSGYFKFYLELPHGYSVTYTSSKNNRLAENDPNYENNKGSYLPPSSVVPQQIELTFNVEKTNDNSSNSIWGEGTTSTVTKEAVLKDNTSSTNSIN